MVVPASSPTRVDVVTPAEFSTVVVLTPVIVVLVGGFVAVVSAINPMTGFEIIPPAKFDPSGDALVVTDKLTAENFEKNTIGIPD
jgi:hypothetical protein